MREGFHGFQPAQSEQYRFDEDISRIERTRMTTEHILEELDTLPDFEKEMSQNALLKVPVQELIVRRENPDQLVELLSTKQPLEINFVGGTPYSNSVVWHPDIDGAKGLDNAYLEGFSQKDNVVMVYGFEKPEGFYFERLADSQQSFAGVDRSRVRSAAGFVPFEAIQFVSVRVPGVAFPEHLMTEEEKDQLFEYTENTKKNKNPFFVYRCYLRKQKGRAS